MTMYSPKATYENSTPTHLTHQDMESSVDNHALTLSVTIILVVFIIITILGNSLVCLTFYRQPELKKVCLYPILSLAIGDLLCGMLAMPAYIAKKHVTGGWQERLTCDVFRFTYFFAGYASVLNLTVVSIERFLAIKMPLKHRTWLTKRKMIAALIASWLDAALVSVLPFFWRKKSEKPELCTYSPTKAWSMMVIIANVSVPFLVMLCCHLSTVCFAIRYVRKKHKDKATEYRQTCQSSDTEDARESNKATILKKEREITCTFSIVVGAFFVCWAPSSFYYFTRIVCPQCHTPGSKETEPIFKAGVKLLTFLNSFLNPLIYCWISKPLRIAFYKSLRLA